MSRDDFWAYVFVAVAIAVLTCGWLLTWWLWNNKRKQLGAWIMRTFLQKNTARTCVFSYVGIVLLSLFFAPWLSPASTYSEAQIHWAPIFYPPNVHGRTPHLMFEQILLVWGALGMLTAAIVWVTRRQN